MCMRELLVNLTWCVSMFVNVTMFIRVAWRLPTRAVRWWRQVESILTHATSHWSGFLFAGHTMGRTCWWRTILIQYLANIQWLVENKYVYLIMLIHVLILLELTLVQDIKSQGLYKWQKLPHNCSKVERDNEFILGNYLVTTQFLPSYYHFPCVYHISTIGFNHGYGWHTFLNKTQPFEKAELSELGGGSTILFNRMSWNFRWAYNPMEGLNFL
jgi:hypothetical protein